MEHHNEVHTGIIEEHLPPHNEEAGGSLLQIDGTLVFIAASFVLFTIVMQRVFYGPLAQIRQQRHEHIDGLKESAEKALNSSEKLEAEYTEKIKAARKKVSDNTATVMADANNEKAKILEERKQQVAEFLHTNRQQVQEEKNKSLENLKQNIHTYAEDIFRKIIEHERIH